MNGYVYIIEQVGTAFCKVGVSDRPAERLVSLQRKNPNRIAIRYILEPAGSVGAYALETLIHSHLAGVRLDGEWFKMDARQVMRTIYGEFGIMTMIARVIEYPDWVIKPRKKREWPRVSVPVLSFEARAMWLFAVAGCAALFMMYGAWAGELAMSLVEYFLYLVIVIFSCFGIMSVAIHSRLSDTSERGR